MGLRLSSQPPTINHYPPEIWRAIMDHADQSTLQEASLVCNAFRDISQSLIFQTFTWSDTVMASAPTPNPLMPVNFKSHVELLHKTSCITSSPRLLSFIRELSFVFMVPSETPEYHKAFTLWRAVLPKMYLTTFTFVGIVLPDILHQPLRDQRTLRVLVSPSITGCQRPCHFHPRHNRASGSLRTLELSNPFGDRYDPRYRFIGPRTCTTLIDLIYEHTHTLIRLRLDAQMLYEALVGIGYVPSIPQLSFLQIDEPPAAPDAPLAPTFAFVDAFANFAVENSSVKELIWMYHSGVVILPLRLSPEALPNLQRFSGVGVAAPSFAVCAKVSSFELEFRALIVAPLLPVAPRNANTKEEILETLEALKGSAPSTHTLEIAFPQFDHEIFPAIMCFSELRILKLTGPLGSEANEAEPSTKRVAERLITIILCVMVKLRKLEELQLSVTALHPLSLVQVENTVDVLLPKWALLAANLKQVSIVGQSMFASRERRWRDGQWMLSRMNPIPVESVKPLPLPFPLQAFDMFAEQNLKDPEP